LTNLAKVDVVPDNCYIVLNGSVGNAPHRCNLRKTLIQTPSTRNLFTTKEAEGKTLTMQRFNIDKLNLSVGN
jgi:hypothetical protein